MNLINDTSVHSGDVLSNLPSLLTGYGNTTALNTGSKLMALLFKNKQSDTRSYCTDFIHKESPQLLY
jgi:hypothetical protein